MMSNVDLDSNIRTKIAASHNKSPRDPLGLLKGSDKLPRNSSITSFSTANETFTTFSASVRDHTEENANEAVRRYLQRCVDELPVETPDLLFAGRRSTMLLQSILRVFVFDEEKTGGNSTKNVRAMPPGGVMVVIPNRTNDCIQKLLIVKDKELAKQFAVEAGAIEAITRLMRNFKDSPRYQAKAVELLGILGQNIPAHQDEIAVFHGVSFISGILVHPQHSKNDRLCADTCEALARICSKYSKAALSQFAEACDGITTLLGVIKRYHSEKYAPMHENILKLLVNIATYEETSEDAPDLAEEKEASDDELELVQKVEPCGKCYPFLQYVEDPDVIDTIMNSLVAKHYKKASKNVSDQSCLLIHILATQGRRFGIRNALIRKKAVSVVLKGMKLNEGLTNDCLQMQLKGLETLYWFAYERKEAREAILQDGCATIMDAMLLSQRMFSTKSLEPTSVKPVDIPRRACQLFDVLCEHEETKAATKCIAKNLKKNPKVREVLKELKGAYPDECGPSVDRLSAAFNQVYGF